MINKFKCSFLLDFSQLHAFASTRRTFVHTHLLRDLYLPLLPSAGMINWFHLRRQHWQIGSGCLDRHAENNFEAGNATGEEECCDQWVTFALNVKNGSGSTCVFVTFSSVSDFNHSTDCHPFSSLNHVGRNFIFSDWDINSLYWLEDITRKSGYAK